MSCEHILKHWSSEISNTGLCGFCWKERCEVAERDWFKAQADMAKMMADETKEQARLIRERDEALSYCEKLRNLLSVPGCVVEGCGGKGWFETVGTDQYGEPEQQQTQCQWCFEKEEVLASMTLSRSTSKIKEARLLETDANTAGTGGVSL